MKIENDADVKAVVRTDNQRAEKLQPRQRIPFGVPRARLSVLGTLPGWFYAWINDDAGRIEEAQLGGYEFVSRNEIILAPGVSPTNSDLGDRISTIVGKSKEGGPMRAYLMKIPNELKEEAREMLREIRKKRTDSIKRGRMGVEGMPNLYNPNQVRISSGKD